MPESYLFSGIITCPHCGRKLVGQHRKGGANNPEGTYHYRCNKARIEHTCPLSGCHSERKIETQLLNNLAGYIQNEITKVESLSDIQRPKTDNSKKIEELKKEMERLNMMFRKGRISEEEYDKEYFAGFGNH